MRRSSELSINITRINKQRQACSIWTAPEKPNLHMKSLQNFQSTDSTLRAHIQQIQRRPQDKEAHLTDLLSLTSSKHTHNGLIRSLLISVDRCPQQQPQLLDSRS